MELNGFRKIIDNSFMQGFLISGDVERKTAQAHFPALRRAPADVDSNPNNFKELVLEHSVLKKFRSAVKNMGALGIPTRIVSGLYRGHVSGIPTLDGPPQFFQLLGDQERGDVSRRAMMG